MLKIQSICNEVVIVIDTEDKVMVIIVIENLKLM